MKDFDTWNTQKKDIDTHTKSVWPKRRQVWWCTFGVNIGREEDGSGESYERPALVLRVFANGTALVVPLTRAETNTFRFDLEAHGYRSRVLLDQLRVVSTKRLTRFVESVDRETFVQVLAHIRRINWLE